MRKWIFIALVAVVVIGVLAYTLMPPPEGSVEWHKRQYLALLYPKPSLKERISDRWDRLRGQSFFRCVIPAVDFGTLQEHLNALEELGYLKPRLVVFTNVRIDEASDRLTDGATKAIPEGIWRIYPGGTNALFVIRPKEDREIWERLIREADVPESGKVAEGRRTNSE